MQEKHQQYLLFKADGYVSQFVTNEPKGYKKELLGEFHDFPEGIMAIGRLDEVSEGLLLLTTNGKLSYYINSSEIVKEYFTQVDGIITEEAIDKLKNGLTLSNQGSTYKTKPCEAKTKI